MSDLLEAVHRVLGCQWGQRVALAGDREPCDLKAVQIVVLHGHPDEGEFAVKLCASHREKVLAETEPHSVGADTKTELG